MIMNLQTSLPNKSTTKIAQRNLEFMASTNSLSLESTNSLTHEINFDPLEGGKYSKNDSTTSLTQFIFHDYSKWSLCLPLHFFFGGVRSVNLALIKAVKSLKEIKGRAIKLGDFFIVILLACIMVSTA